MGSLCDQISAPGFDEKFRNIVNEGMIEEARSAEQTRSKLDRQIASLDRRLNAAVDGTLLNNLSDAVAERAKQRMNEMEEELETLRRKRQRLPSAYVPKTVQTVGIVGLRDGFKNIIARSPFEPQSDVDIALLKLLQRMVLAVRLKEPLGDDRHIEVDFDLGSWAAKNCQNLRRTVSLHVGLLRRTKKSYRTSRLHKLEQAYAEDSLRITDPELKALVRKVALPDALVEGPKDLRSKTVNAAVLWASSPTSDMHLAIAAVDGDPRTLRSRLSHLRRWENFDLFSASVRAIRPGVELDFEKMRVRRRADQNFRARLEEAGHPLLRSWRCDPDKPWRPLTDDEWGLIAEYSPPRQRRSSNPHRVRDHLDGMFYAIKYRHRWDEIFGKGNWSNSVSTTVFELGSTGRLDRIAHRLLLLDGVIAPDETIVYPKLPWIRRDFKHGR